MSDIDHTIPEPHIRFRGSRQRRASGILEQAGKWSIPGMLLTRICTVALYASRLIDRRTGKAFSADELATAADSPVKIAIDSAIEGIEGGELAYLENEVVDAEVAEAEVITLCTLALTAGTWDVEGIISAGANFPDEISDCKAWADIVVTNAASIEGSAFTTCPNGAAAFQITPWKKRFVLTESATARIRIFANFIMTANPSVSGTIQSSAKIIAKRVA